MTVRHAVWLPWSWLGRIGYEEGLGLQRRHAEELLAGRAAEHLYLLEHPPTFTIGRQGTPEEVLWDERECQRRGVRVFTVDRGGRITYHGPGQLVGYPVLDLRRHGRDVHAYLRGLEEVLIRALGEYGIQAHRVEGRTGVWVAGAKIAAIGVKVSRWVTTHGFALNVTTDLDYFRGIVPCGIADADVTSVVAVTGRAIALEEMAEAVAEHFARVFAAASSAHQVADHK